ncbi:MAG: nucleotidyltransferase family protein, partial [Candidatus Eremiobacteraeota bacterium]|nr:nucleotidyltransferase family protein [Candidatus Eremiobacteraeota bacterium]
MPLETARLTPSTQAQLVRTALAAGRRARIAMRGTSMLPFLREPMVLELDRFRGSARVGEIVVFRTDERLVAHRVVGRRGDALLCAGDAEPGRVEQIERSAVVGVVAAVWSSADGDARRIDGVFSRVIGTARARTRRLRAFLCRALPWKRPRTFATLYATIGAIIQNRSALQAFVENADPFELAQVAKRTGCAELLHQSLERTPGPEAAALRALLRRERWSTAVRSAKLRDQLRQVVELLNAAGIEPILLKGAARLWSGDPSASLHDSVDLDLLVADDELAAARTALVEAGYRDDLYRDIAWYYQNVHHHLAPLLPQCGVGVELHRALAPPGRLSFDARGAAVRGYAVETRAGETRAYVLNRIATALHLAIHPLERLKWRDIFLLAEQVAQMDENERRALQSIVHSERLEPVRLQAIVYAAA